MTMTMDDDGAILVHLTNPGGIVGGTGVANQITYWTDTDTIGGDAGLTYDAATDTITVAGNILMADDHFIGITGDIRIEFDQTDGDIMLHLGDAVGGDRVQVVDSAGGVVVYIDSSGNADFAGNAAIGELATVSPVSKLVVYGAYDNTAGTRYGFRSRVDFGPTANFNSTIKGFMGEVYVGNNFAQTGGAIIGMEGTILCVNGATLTNLILLGGNYTIDVEDASSHLAAGLYAYTPLVDTGSCTSGYGARIKQGAVGTGSITTLYGLYIEAMTAGNTSYAIYSAGGNSFHSGRVAIGGTIAPMAQLHVDQSSGSGAVPVLYLDQADVSEEMVEFACTIGAGNAIEAVGGKTLTTTHFIKVTLPGALTRYIPVGTIA